MAAQRQIVLKNVRCSYLNALEVDKKYGKYGGSFLFPKTDKAQFKLVDEAVKAVADEQWGAKASGLLKKMSEDKMLCLKDGDKMTNSSGDADEVAAGHFVVRAGSDTPPRVMRGRDEITPENKGKFRDGVPYSGCYAHVILTIWAQDNDWGKRINAGFDAIAFHKDGERFGGGGGISSKKAIDTFGELLDDSDTSDAFGGTEEAEEAEEDEAGLC